MSLRIALFLSAVAIAPGLALGAPNLIANPRLDVGVAEWSAGLGAATVSWSPLDETGKPASGSLRMAGLEAHTTNDAWSSCFQVSPESTIVFGASAYSLASGALSTYVRLVFFDDPSCLGSSVGAIWPAAEDYYLLGAATWGSIQGNGTVPATAQSAELVLAVAGGVTPPTEVFFDNAYVHEGETCAATATIACLNARRFRVSMKWQIPDGTRGHGSVVTFTGDSMRASFFTPANVEAVLKVLDGCSVNDRYWVFAAGLTNVNVQIRVTDTHSGEVWEYENPPDQAFPPVQDTTAFAGCAH